MKRTPLRRKTALRTTSAPRRTWIRRRPPASVDAETKRRMKAFHEAIRGDRCAGCGRTAAEAREQTGFGHHAHHAIRRQTLRKRSLDEWPPDLAVALCEEPCHRRQTSGKERVPLGRLPGRATRFAAAHGLLDALEREHPR